MQTYHDQQPFRPGENIRDGRQDSPSPTAVGEASPSRFVVLAAIELHREAQLRTVEVQDERACGVLPPELGSRYLAAPEIAPEQSLGIGLLGSQASAVAELWAGAAHHGFSSMYADRRGGRPHPSLSHCGGRG